MRDDITTNPNYHDPPAAGPGLPDKPDDDMGFAPTEEQQAAARHAGIKYSHADNATGETAGMAGNVGTGAGTLGDALAGSSAAGTRNRATQNPVPGPGTAADRGYGTTGSNDFGTGLGATGLGSDSGMDQRSLGQEPDPSDAGDNTYGANETFAGSTGTFTEGRGSVGMDQGQGGVGDGGLGRDNNR